jgi:putative acetyltransferase
MVRAHIELIQADSPELVERVRQLFREYAEGVGTDLEYQGFTAELAALPAQYILPRGALLVACADGDVLGCVALRALDRRTGEMKRLYVRPAYQSCGVVERLVQAVIDIALRAGYRELRLDTLPTMSAAQALYRRLGFEEIPAYNTKHLPGTRFYALKLSA